MAPLPVVGTPERAPVAGRAAVVHLEVCESLTDKVEPEWPEGSVRLVGGAAMGAHDGRNALATTLARRACGPPQVAFDPEPVSTGEHDAPVPAAPGADVNDRRSEFVPGGDARPPADSRHRQQPQVLRSRLALPIAATHAPSASQTGRQTPSQGLIR